MRLSLHAEPLTELAPADLAAVAGGALPTLKLDECLVLTTPTGYYPSLNAPCDTTA